MLLSASTERCVSCLFTNLRVEETRKIRKTFNQTSGSDQNKCIANTYWLHVSSINDILFLLFILKLQIRTSWEIQEF